MKIIPKKFIRCVKKVTKQQKKHSEYKRVNPYAVCRKAVGYYGTTKDIGLLKPKKKKRK